MNKPFNVCTTRAVGDKTFWTVVGAAFPHRKGRGFNVILQATPIAVKGQIKLVILPPRDVGEEAAGD